MKGQVVFRIEGGVLHWAPTLHSQITASSSLGISIDLQGSDEGLHSDAEFRNDGAQLLWNNGDVWARLLDMSTLKALRDLLRHSAWTEKARPGEHVYVFTDDHISVDDLESMPFTFTRDHIIITRLGGTTVNGKLVDGEIVWDHDGLIWIPVPFDKLDNRRWTQESQPGVNIYVVTQGIVGGGDLDPTEIIAQPGGAVFAKLRGKDAAGRLEQNGDILWEAHTGEGRWLALLSPDEMRSRLEGLRWTEEERPWDRTFSVSDATFLGRDAPLPFVMLRDGRLFAQVEGADMTAGKMLDNGEIHWEGKGNPIWVTVEAVEEMNYQIEGKRWTEKVNPGKQLYTISDYMVTGVPVPAKFTLLPDRSIVSGLPGKASGTMLDNWDIQWGEPGEPIGDENTWLVLASRQEVESKMQAHEWTSEARPGEEVYTVHDDMVEGSGGSGAFTLLSDGRVFTGLAGKESGKLLQNGEIVWDSGDAPWVAVDAVEAMRASVQGMRWTEAASPGRRIYTVRDGFVSDGPASASFDLLPDGGVVTALGRGSRGKMLDGGEIQWGAGGMWLPVASPGLTRRTLEGIRWANTAESSQHVLVVNGDRVLRDGSDINVTILLLADASHVYTSSAAGIAEGVFQPNGEIVWKGSRAIWTPVGAGGGGRDFSQGNATMINLKVGLLEGHIAPRNRRGAVAWSVIPIVTLVAVALSLVSGFFRCRRGGRGDFSVVDGAQAPHASARQVLLGPTGDGDLA